MPFTAHEVGSSALYPLGGAAPAGPNANGHEYVDLGLPSGRLWATCNVGADTPEGYGLYFQWGDTQGYPDAESGNDFSESSYKYFADGAPTKYTGSDGLTELELSDDAARTHLGGDWRMPSEADIDELLSGTTHVWTSRNGVTGRLFTSKVNGNDLFIPAAGLCHGGSLDYRGSDCYVWSRSLYPNDPRYACSLYCYSGNADRGYDSRYDGFSVRGVL